MSSVPKDLYMHIVPHVKDGILVLILGTSMCETVSAISYSSTSFFYFNMKKFVTRTVSSDKLVSLQVFYRKRKVQP